MSCRAPQNDIIIICLLFSWKGGRSSLLQSVDSSCRMHENFWMGHTADELVLGKNKMNVVQYNYI